MASPTSTPIPTPLRLTRKTRIVCISDTHNQTPKLPPGDILIHAGDITNQGSYSEMKKMVEWMEKADFEAKIVVAGNHEVTFDAEHYRENLHRHKWAEPQDTRKCRELLTSSPSITYLENQSVLIYLTSPSGPRTCLKVFGSPCTFSKRFAFGLKSEEEAERMWEKIEEDTDIVVTHTPAKGVMDECEEGKELGCPALMRKLAEVRPLMHVCGHVHEGRGVRRVRWRDEPIDVWESRLGENTQPDVLTMLVTNIDKPQAIEPDSLAASFIEAEEHWQDPGAGNKKLSLVDVTRKAGRALENTGCLTRHIVSDSLRKIVGGQSVSDEDCQPDSDKSKSTTSLEGSALVEDGAGMWRRTRGGAIESRIRSDVGCEVDQAVGERLRERQESVMINAAFVGPRGSANKPTSIGRKPIVVDIELPVWDLETVSNAA